MPYHSQRHALRQTPEACVAFDDPEAQSSILIRGCHVLLRYEAPLDWQTDPAWCFYGETGDIMARNFVEKAKTRKFFGLEYLTYCVEMGLKLGLCMDAGGGVEQSPPMLNSKLLQPSSADCVIDRIINNAHLCLENVELRFEWDDSARPKSRGSGASAQAGIRQGKAGGMASAVGAQLTHMHLTPGNWATEVISVELNAPAPLLSQ